jgi:large subunit ribosomal protein L19e
MASTLLKCGANSVWMDHDRVDEIAKAVTKDDIRILINGKAVKKKQAKSISNARKKYVAEQKKKGRRRGYGSRKGAKYARLSRKDQWIRTIRPIRSDLKVLRDEKKISRTIYRNYYRKAKGGEFRSRAHLKSHLIADGVIKKEDVKK